MPDRDQRRASETNGDAADPHAGETAVLTPVPPGGRVPPSLKDVSFPTVVRGYDRREVDSYVKRVNGVIAELEMSQSPESAVKHALDRVGEQTAAVLQRAREAAEQLTATALSESEHASRRARVEAQETLERARAEAEALHADSREEAEALTQSAEREAAEQLRRAQAEIASGREQAEARMKELGEEMVAATAARDRALDELAKLASELAEFAAASRERHTAPPVRTSAEVSAKRPPAPESPAPESAGDPAGAADHPAEPGENAAEPGGGPAPTAGRQAHPPAPPKPAGPPHRRPRPAASRRGR